MLSKDFITISDHEVHFHSHLVWRLDGYGNTGQHKSILQILEERSDKFRSRYQKLICEYLELLSYKLDKHDSSQSIPEVFFWMGLLAEMNPLKSETSLNALSMLVIAEELKKTSTNGIQYIGSKSDLAEAFELLCMQHNISFQWVKKSKKNQISFFRKFWESLPRSLSSMIYFFRYIFKSWNLKKKGSHNWFDSENVVFFFSNFAHMDKNSGDAGVFYSRQWEILPELLRKKGKLANWMHIFISSSAVPNTSTGNKWIESFNENSLSQGYHAFLESHLSLKVLKKSFLDWVKIVFIFKWLNKKIEDDLNKLTDGWLWPVLRKDWVDSSIGMTAIQNMLWIQLFNTAMSKLPKQKLGFYLCENQGWERAFVYYWKKYGHGKIIGVAHTTTPYWLLPYFDAQLFGIRRKLSLPRPDMIAINGPANWEILKKAGQPTSQYVKVEALRYLYLNECVNNSKRKANSQVGERILLLLGDILRETTHRMMLVLEEVYKNIQTKYKIWIKPHPANLIDLKKYSKLEAYNKYAPLKDLLPITDIVFASVFTSASVDAYCSNIPVINYLDPYALNLSPLRGVEGVKFVNTPETLCYALNLIESSDYKTGNPEEFFWLDPKLPNWNKLF